MVASIESIHTYIQVWVTVQRNWLYLQPIFESPDINRQLPAEGTEISNDSSGLILNSFNFDVHFQGRSFQRWIRVGGRRYPQLK